MITERRSSKQWIIGRVKTTGSFSRDFTLQNSHSHQLLSTYVVLVVYSVLFMPFSFIPHIDPVRLLPLYGEAGEVL